MRVRRALDSVALCRLLLRTAGLLVPAASRADWAAEWEAELWYVRKRGTPADGEDQHARSNPGEPMAGVSPCPAWFCLGAFQDALWLGRNRPAGAPPRAMRQGSPATCLSRLAMWVAAFLLLGLALPGARQAILPAPYPNADGLVMISRSGQTTLDIPSVRLADYRDWETTAHHLFTELAYYQPVVRRVHIAAHRTAELSIVRASGELFSMLRIPSPAARAGEKDVPGLMLSAIAWREYFNGDPDVAGRLVQISGRQVRIIGVLSSDLWRLPGRADAWMIASEGQMDSLGPNTRGFVLARILPSAFPAGPSGDHWITVFRPGGDAERFDCVSLAQQARQPFSIYLFILFVACLALPATTPLPLGEYRACAGRRAWNIRLRRWLFLAAKLALILPLVYCASIDAAYGRLFEVPVAHALHSTEGATSQYLELATSFFGLLFAFRWALRDQRGRCPVCLRQLTNPARVGEASRNFLAWNGTELICSGGHGLLHIPEIPTSWFSTQRWLALDPSWSGLFRDGSIAPAGVL